MARIRWTKKTVAGKPRSRSKDRKQYCCTTVLRLQPRPAYAVLMTVCGFSFASVRTCFFNHILALHRPIKGAAAIMKNEIPKASRILYSSLPRKELRAQTANTL